MDKPTEPEVTDRMLTKDQEEDLLNDYVSTNALMQKEWSTVMPEASQEGGYGVWSQENRASLDLMTLKGLFTNDEWVFILVDLIASKIASQELKVMKETFQNGVATYEADEQNPLQELIYNPNANQTYYQFMYSVVADLILAGNAIVYRMVSTGELIHIPIETINMEFDTDGKLLEYRVVQFSTGYEMPLPRLVMTLDPKQVAHFRTPNPSSALWGLSPFIPGRKSILFNRYSLEYLNNFYLKGAQPGLILSIDKDTNEKVAIRMLRSLEMAHTGRKNQRRNMILPKGVKADALNQSLADQQLKDYIDQNRETVMNLLHVSKHVLSLMTKGSLGSEDFKIAAREFWSTGLKPKMKEIEACLSKLFKNELGQNQYLEFDLSDVEALQDDLNEKADLAIKLLQTHTLNEVRAKVFDEQPLPGGDITPVQKPIQDISAPPPPQGKSAEPLPAPTPEPMVPIEEVLDPRAKTLDDNKKALETLKAHDSGWWKKRDATLQKNEVQRFSAIHGASLHLFADQVAKAVKVVRKDLTAGGFKAVMKQNKHYIRKADFNENEIKRKIRDALASLEQQWLDGTGSTLEASADLGYDAQFTLPFNLSNRSEIEALRGSNEQNRRNQINGRSGFTFAQLNQTTTDKIMGIIEEGITNSRSLQEIADNIVADVGDPVVNQARAMTIARTEVLTATSIGQAAAMKDAAEVIPDLQKMWINAGDDRVRGNPGGLYKNSDADHWSLGGELVTHDADFSNGLSFPRDPKGEAGEVINCRCTFIMVPKEDAGSLGIRQIQDSYDEEQGTNNANSGE